MNEKEPARAGEQRSRTPLYTALGIMLLPALIPLYFALGADDSQTVIFLVSLSLAVAVSNIVIVVALWRWVNRLNGGVGE